MEQILDFGTNQHRFRAVSLSSFGLIALMLAIAGVYSLAPYSVSQRTTETGVRMVLGAKPDNILPLIIVQNMGMVLVGTGVGLAAALLCTRVLSSVLYGVGNTDPATFGLVIALLVVVALLASYIPARRAMRLDPLVALHCG